MGGMPGMTRWLRWRSSVDLPVPFRPTRPYLARWRGGWALDVGGRAGPAAPTRARACTCCSCCCHPCAHAPPPECQHQRGIGDELGAAVADGKVGEVQVAHGGAAWAWRVCVGWGGGVRWRRRGRGKRVHLRTRAARVLPRRRCRPLTRVAHHLHALPLQRALRLCLVGQVSSHLRWWREGGWRAGGVFWLGRGSSPPTPARRRLAHPPAGPPARRTHARVRVCSKQPPCGAWAGAAAAAAPAASRASPPACEASLHPSPSSAKSPLHHRRHSPGTAPAPSCSASEGGGGAHW